MLATDYEDAKPDILVLGKALSGGIMPISAVLANNEVMLCLRPGEHGSTFGGNPLAAAIAKRSIELLEEDGLIENSRIMGDYFKESLLNLNSKIIKEIRGKGLWLGVEIDPDFVSGKDLSKMCLDAGILCKETHETTIRYARFRRGDGEGAPTRRHRRRRRDHASGSHPALATNSSTIASASPWRKTSRGTGAVSLKSKPPESFPMDGGNATSG